MKKYLSALLLMIVLMPSVTLAQDSGLKKSLFLLNNLNTQVTGQTPSNEDRVALTVAALIQTAISLIGLIMVVLIVYAGFLWLTARGNDQQVERAQSYIKNAILGIIVIMMAYAITVFIVQQLTGIVFESRFSPY